MINTLSFACEAHPTRRRNLIKRKVKKDNFNVRFLSLDTNEKATYFRTNGLLAPYVLIIYV